MAALTFFQDFKEQLGKGTHNFSSHTLKLGLTNSAPSATNTLWSDITEIAAGSGYSAGGMTLDSVTFTETGGTATLDAADEALAASGGDIGPYRYVVIYNATAAATSPETPSLIAYADVGSTTTANGTTQTFAFASGYIATIA